MVENIPENIRLLIKNQTVVENTFGCSGSKLYQIGDSMYLKTDRIDSKIKKEVVMMKWLHGKLCVPDIIDTYEDGENFYLLMSKISGEMACSDSNKSMPEETVRLLADGIKMFRSIPADVCPITNNTDAMLKQALYNIEHGLIEKEDWTWELTAELGLTTTTEVYDYLNSNRPDEDLVVSHGDYCLPNVFIENGKISGFIDLGDSGVSDKWHDIMMCLWSIGYNLKTDKYNDLFFERLEIVPDYEKLRYYEILSTLII